MAARGDAGGGTGCARRRRERRLRSHLRHERMAVAIALAECQHHSAQRQKKARAREEECVMHHTAAFRMIVPLPEPELFDLFEEPGGGGGGAAQLAVGAAEATGRGSAARRGADCLFRSFGTDSGCSCAADGGTAVRRAPVLRQAFDFSRAGYGNAQGSS